MRWLFCVVALLLAIGSAEAQQCSQDPQGNQVCVGTQPNNYSCGCLDLFADCHFHPISCNDVFVQKTAPGGQPIYTRVLGGESDQTPRQFFFDSQNNVVLFGTTYSKQFPVTPDAIQSSNAGPTDPFSEYGSLPEPGGDLFLSILSPSGGLLYSTFLGSSSNDTIPGIQAAPGGQIEVLVSAQAGNFPTVPAKPATSNGGPVLLTFDRNSRTITQSLYLPIVAPSGSSAVLQSDGTIAVTTAGGLYVFGRDGQQRSFVSLQSFAFSEVPQVSTGPAGDLWLVGPNSSRQVVVAKLTAGTVEVFRWMLPVADDGHSYFDTFLQGAFFGPDGLTYLGGDTSMAPGTSNGQLLSTTPNALLEAPCSNLGIGIVAVLSAQGDVKLLSYLPGLFSSFSANPDGSVSVVLTTGKSVPLDLGQRPKTACVADALDRPSGPPPTLGVGQIVRLQGGGFGPGSPAGPSLDANQTYAASLDGLSVLVSGVAAPILWAGPGEVVFAIPFATPDGDAVPVIVQDHGQQSAAFPIAVRASAPWLIDPILNADGTPNWFTTPASWGSTVTLYVTGAGRYSPALLDGQIAPLDISHGLQLPVSVSFLTTGPVPQAGTILYAGPAPGLVGVAQINIQLPPSGPHSSFDAILTVGSVSVGLPAIWLK